MPERFDAVVIGAGPPGEVCADERTLAIRAEIPIDVPRDTIQPFPTFSEVFLNALQELDA